jgi:hypothetical protein
MVGDDGTQRKNDKDKRQRRNQSPRRPLPEHRPRQAVTDGKHKRQQEKAEQ